KYSNHVIVLGVSDLHVNGLPGLGRVIAAAVAWGPQDAVVTYQWYRGTSVVGTGASSVVQSGDVGKDMVLKVTVSKAGLGSHVKYSEHFMPTL
ncbi:MAG: hypothetical protein LBR19_02175, partial [Bifidobacteriaceae bacterium]|nr:hypothetical protein [Bifidobacteriaceae bacterium]